MTNFERYRETMDSQKRAEEMKKRKEEEMRKNSIKNIENISLNDMLEYVEGRIKGQTVELKKAVLLVYMYLQNVAKGEPFTACNWLLTAPSGSGKTEFFRSLRAYFKENDIPVPVVQIDLSQFTETGYKGKNTDLILNSIVDAGYKTDGFGICFLDEADKKCLPSYGNFGSDFNEAVQSNLLTMIEGIESSVESKSGENIRFDTSKTMFIFTGAFQKIRNKKQDCEIKKSTFGFNDASEIDKNSVVNCFYEDLKIQDIVDFGMQEELAGRLTQIINFKKISEKEMIDLINHKVEEISKELGFNIHLMNDVVYEFLEVSYTNLGIRKPMNLIKELVCNAVSKVCYDGKFDAENDIVHISSINEAFVSSMPEDEINMMEYEQYCGKCELYGC